MCALLWALRALPPPPPPTPGTHNLAVLNSGGADGGLTEKEYENWAWHDARLTDLGKEQSSTVAPKLTALGHAVDLVLVSPLSRTIQTALLAVPGSPPFVVDERIRERNGKHPCDKRRPRGELEADFPGVDFSSLLAEEDDTWTTTREPWEKLVARAGDFCRALAARKEGNIAIVTHNDFLQALLLEAPELKTAEPALRKKFANAEMLALWYWAEPLHIKVSVEDSEDVRVAVEFTPRPE